MLSSVAFGFSAVLATAAAQQYNPFTFPPYFNINDVSTVTLGQWCLAERNSCPLICGGVANSNLCNPATLQFSCICGNGSMANVAPYAQTVPSLVCEQNFNGCIQANVGNLTGQNECKANKLLCGTLNATSADVSTSASSSPSSSVAVSTASATATGSPSVTSPASASTTSKGAAAALDFLQERSSNLLVGALLVAVGMAM